MSLFRLKNLYNGSEINNEEDELYLNVLVMLISKIKRQKTLNGSFKFEFSVLQTETDGWTTVTYISEAPEQELKFVHLFEPVGTLLYMNTCLRDGKNLILEYSDKMAAVALRPNDYHVRQFLKVRFQDIFKHKIKYV